MISAVTREYVNVVSMIYHLSMGSVLLLVSRSKLMIPVVFANHAIKVYLTVLHAEVSSHAANAQLVIPSIMDVA